MQDAAMFRSTPSPYPRAETSPTPRLPGYIPGMPRPMTPRDANFDLDEASPSSSSTPRATSPRIPSTDRATSPAFTSSGVLRRDSTSMRQPHRAASPLLTNPGTPITSLLSGVNGRFTPDRSHSPDSPSVDFGNPIDSSLLGRRRPVSPYSQGAYQSMTVSSRSSTPSNVTWKAPASPSGGNAGGQSRSGSVVGFSETDFAMSGLPSQVRNGFDRPSMHTRNDSNMSSSDLHEVIAQLSRSGSLVGSRSLRSPALPDSPLFESAAQSSGAFTLSTRGQPPSLGSDIGSSPPRSSTPTQYSSRSSVSPAFSDHDPSRSSRRGSHQAAASPFALNQSQALVLSPLANSSRSSLESAGSSYHTWEDKQDRTIPRVAALEPQPPAWHDLSDKAGDLSSGADVKIEEIVQQHSGLNKGDFVAIQERLLSAAKLKAEVSEPRERRNSLRRRRPSASQSVSQIHLSTVKDGLNDVWVADATQQGSPPRAMSPQNVLKASALLDSVVDSIQGPRSKNLSDLSELRTDTDVVADSSTEPEPSSATRRKNALARALFGASDSDQSLTSPSPLPTDEPNTGSYLPAERPPLVESSTSALSLRETLLPSSPSVNAGVITSSSSTEQPNKQQELAKEVQRRTEAAMADLNRMPSNAKVHDASQRRRVERGQISGPKLVSASTSVDTFPVRSPSALSGQLSAAQNQSPTSTKFGTRFKKIRGSLRTKPAFPTSDGSTQYPAELPSSSGDRSLASTPDGLSPFSAAEPSRPKLAIASPAATVATSGPGLKGFVSRFLRPRSGETPDPERRRQWPSSSASLATTSSYFAHQQSERNPDMDVSQQFAQSAPPDNKSFRPDTPVSPESTSPHKPPPSAPPVTSSAPDAGAARAVDEGALKQFIDAANNLGLDQDALTELLARSTSVGSRLTTQNPKHLSAPSVDRSGHGKSDPPSSGPVPLSAVRSSAHRSLVQPSQRPAGEIIEKAPIRRPLARNAATSEAANSTIVRRTLIFPSEARQATPEPGMGLRKSSSTRRRRSTSAASMLSNRSLHDRVPTPPPPKSSTARRFSAEQSPPMPHIPSSLMAQTEAINAPQSAPAVPLEKSNSAYDSL